MTQMKTQSEIMFGLNNADKFGGSARQNFRIVANGPWSHTLEVNGAFVAYENMLADDLTTGQSLYGSTTANVASELNINTIDIAGNINFFGDNHAMGPLNYKLRTYGTNTAATSATATASNNSNNLKPIAERDLGELNTQSLSRYDYDYHTNAGDMALFLDTKIFSTDINTRISQTQGAQFNSKAGVDYSTSFKYNFEDNPVGADSIEIGYRRSATGAAGAEDNERVQLMKYKGSIPSLPHSGKVEFSYAQIDNLNHDDANEAKEGILKYSGTLEDNASTITDYGFVYKNVTPNDALADEESYTVAVRGDKFTALHASTKNYNGDPANTSSTTALILNSEFE